MSLLTPAPSTSDPAAPRASTIRQPRVPFVLASGDVAATLPRAGGKGGTLQASIVAFVDNALRKATEKDWKL